MSDPIAPQTESAPAGDDEFIADLKARVRATQRRLEEEFPNTVVVWPDIDGPPEVEDEIARIDS
jgi:hypothetical protein